MGSGWCARGGIRAGISPASSAIIRRFFDDHAPPALTAACFGVAGPVIDGRCITTNLPWTLDERTLAAEIPVPRARLLNDLEAMAWGVMSVPPGDLVVLQPGTPRAGQHGAGGGGNGPGRGPDDPGRCAPPGGPVRGRARRLCPPRRAGSGAARVPPARARPRERRARPLGTWRVQHLSLPAQRAGDPGARVAPPGHRRRGSQRRRGRGGAGRHGPGLRRDARPVRVGLRRGGRQPGPRPPWPSRGSTSAAASRPSSGPSWRMARSSAPFAARDAWRRCWRRVPCGSASTIARPCWAPPTWPWAWSSN